jgi:beta-ribofuranosylaminobenzene 5'-phosphate synthase
MSATILISTGSRLHFGFFAHAGSEPLRAGAINYGGIGLMIDAPGVVLAASQTEGEVLDPDKSVAACWTDSVVCNLKNARAAEQDPFVGPPVDEWEQLAARALKYISTYRKHCPAEEPTHCEMELWSAIPSHQGLGAGTQLGMAVASALSGLSGERNVDVVTLAKRVGRGARSAIGIHGFGSGGFLVDSGKERDDAIGGLETRVEVPTGWRFLLVNPPGRAAGLSGTAESAALSQLPPTPDEMTQRLRRLALSEIVPALSAGDCDRFGESLFEFGQTVGNYFRPIQGGTYATPSSSDLVDWIRKEGFRGVAQTSWGPTLAVCCANQASAETLREKMLAETRWVSCRTRITRALNAGAKVQRITGSGAV